MTKGLKGGQGRSAEDLEQDALGWMGLLLVLLSAALVGAFFWEVM